MKIYFPIFLLFLVVACSKEKETDEDNNTTPVVPTCSFKWVKPYEGYFKIRRRWPEFDSTYHFVTWTYDTLFMDCHLAYHDCNVLYYQEGGFAFPFDSTLMSTVNLSTTFGWTAYSTLSLDTITDSIYIHHEYGHLGRNHEFYVGRRE